MSGVLVAWANPPNLIPARFNPNDPLEQTRDDEIDMKLVYIIPFLKFLGILHNIALMLLV